MIYRYKKQNWHLVKSVTPGKLLHSNTEIRMKFLAQQEKYCRDNFGRRGLKWRRQMLWLSYNQLRKNPGMYIHEYFMFIDDCDATAFKLVWK